MSKSNEIANKLKGNLNAIKKAKIHEKNMPNTVDELENEIDRLKEEMQKSMWLIGQRLSKIKNEKLYETKYKDFTEYCTYRFEFNRRTAYRFLFIYDNFTFETARTHGSKLRLLEGIKDDEKCKELLEWMDKESPSFREVEQKVKELKTSSDKETNEIEPKSKPIIKKSTKTIIIDKSQLPYSTQVDYLNAIKSITEQVISQEDKYYTSSHTLYNKDDMITIEVKKEKLKEKPKKNSPEEIKQRKLKSFYNAAQKLIDERIFSIRVKEKVVQLIDQIKEEINAD